MDFQAQAYPDARRKTRGACQLHRGGQSQSPVRPLCNSSLVRTPWTRFSYKLRTIPRSRWISCLRLVIFSRSSARSAACRGSSARQAVVAQSGVERFLKHISQHIQQHILADGHAGVGILADSALAQTMVSVYPPACFPVWVSAVSFTGYIAVIWFSNSCETRKRNSVTWR